MAKFLELVGHRGRSAGDLKAHDLHHAVHGTFGHVVHHTCGRDDEIRRLGGKRGVPVSRAGRAGIGCNLVQVDIQFLGDQGGLNVIGPLPGIGPRCDEGDAVLRDLDVRRQHRLARPGGQRVLVRFAHRVDTEGDAADNGDRADKETAAGDCLETSHAQPSCIMSEARLIAARMRG